MRCYETFELSFQGEAPKGSHAEVALSAVFTCGEKKWTVKGFYAGNNTYKVRFLPQTEGEYTWKVSGVVEKEAFEICKETESHGMVKAEGNHFVYQDGSKYLSFWNNDLCIGASTGNIDRSDNGDFETGAVFLRSRVSGGVWQMNTIL